MTNKQAAKLLMLIVVNQLTWATAMRILAKQNRKLAKDKLELYEVGTLVFEAIEAAGRLDLINDNPKLQEYMFDREFSKLTDSYYKEK